MHSTLFSNVKYDAGAFKKNKDYIVQFIIIHISFGQYFWIEK